ncbi:cation transporter, partial [Gemmiger formicilis]|uniref:cation transporter n=1 Tax=Gemmiger formicilis TaxID=745368 RepID=UPI00195B535C
MISDAIHSFSDVLTTLIAWIGVKVSKKASDEEHPYGHEGRGMDQQGIMAGIPVHGLLAGDGDNGGCQCNGAGH